MTTALATRTSTAPAAILSCATCGMECAGVAATTPAGYPICYACAGRMEREGFDLNPARWSGYIAQPAESSRPGDWMIPGRAFNDWDAWRKAGFAVKITDATVTTWTGEPIAIVTECKPTRRRTAEWMGECIYSVKVRNPRTGATYRGLTYGPGMYVSLTRTGAKK